MFMYEPPSKLQLTSVEEFQEAFQLFDSRGDGKIHVAQVGDALRALGQNPTESDVKKCTHHLKPDERISFEVFLPIYQAISKARSGDTAHDFIEGLRHFDKDGNGFISSAELRICWPRVGESWPTTSRCAQDGAVALALLALCWAAGGGRGRGAGGTQRLRASVGGFAVMNCHLDFPFGNEIPYHLQWDKDGEMVLSWLSGWEAPRVGEGWGGRVRRVGGAAAAAAAGGALGGGSLNVSAVRETDAGLFRCRVSFPNRSPPARNNGTFYYLDVDGGTVIATPPVNVAVVEGARAELECGAKEPAARVSWLRDGAPLPLPLPLAARPELALPPNGSLVLRAARPEDAGLYECRVQHDAREQSASAYLDVQYKAKVVYAPRERFLSLGKPASLDCHFSANPPLTNLRWEKDGFLFDPYNVDESHEGQYSCTAYNALGSEGPSPRVRVRVQRPPALLTRPQPLYLARLGQPLALPCAAAPQPHHAPPAVVWTRVSVVRPSAPPSAPRPPTDLHPPRRLLQKDGAPLPADRFVPEEGKLSISAVAEEDRGVLVCTVSNEAADVSAETELLIENLPPRAPHSLTARATAHALHVAWEPGRRGDGAEYTLWYRERAAHEWRTLRLLTRGATEATLAGLRAATPHELRVLAQDSLGDGLFSKPLVVSTLGLFIHPDVEDSEAAFVAAVTQAADAAGTGGDEDEDEAGDGEEGGAGRARGRRAAGDDAAAGRRRAVSSVEEGGQYWARVSCGGERGGAALSVPQYARLRGVAAACAGAALLLAALAAAALLARRRLPACGRARAAPAAPAPAAPLPPPPPPKRRY
ncbi:hypothetical protein MSG28_006055 [Choristoneura fumiferana]|uniref:Uncharacterized protein n=1 Tax=Choristoneura fumiferana TaxID=7141 RepID=A0ACC0JDN1_CHOFU|nr:hypothetical protein MSG28_006055 [Choristoneura fumiferana]